MNWKRPQDELPNEEMEHGIRKDLLMPKLVLKIDIPFVTVGFVTVGSANSLCHSSYEIGYYYNGWFFPKLSSGQEQPNKPFSQRLDKWENIDGKVLTHWCEIEEPI